MEMDDHLCLCFHVSKRKVVNFIRIEKPRRVAQLSECHGAGTGCGWCRPFLKSLFEQMSDKVTPEPRSNTVQTQSEVNLITPEQYAALRAKYVKDGGGTPPPGAIPP